MPSDLVEGKRGAGFIRIDDLSVRHEPEFDQCLETVADAEHQTVSLF